MTEPPLPAPWHRADPADGKARIYLIECGHLLKIGVSAGIKKRLTQLKTGNPYNLNLLASIEVDAKRSVLIERAAHRKLKFCRERREWFDVGLFAAMAVVEAEIRGRDRWDDSLIEFLELEHEFMARSKAGEHDFADHVFEDVISARAELIALDYARADRTFQQSLEHWDA